MVSDLLLLPLQGGEAHHVLRIPSTIKNVKGRHLLAQPVLGRSGHKRGLPRFLGGVDDDAVDTGGYAVVSFVLPVLQSEFRVKIHFRRELALRGQVFERTVRTVSDVASTGVRGSNDNSTLRIDTIFGALDVLGKIGLDVSAVLLCPDGVQNLAGHVSKQLFFVLRLFATVAQGNFDFVAKVIKAVKVHIKFYRQIGDPNVVRLRVGRIRCGKSFQSAAAGRIHTDRRPDESFDRGQTRSKSPCHVSFLRDNAPALDLAGKALGIRRRGAAQGGRGSRDRRLRWQNGGRDTRCRRRFGIWTSAGRGHHRGGRRGRRGLLVSTCYRCGCGHTFSGLGRTQRIGLRGTRRRRRRSFSE